ncbi:UbiA family prenyltransferase [Streptacidiphilus sp. EB129]|uniref:UbiA family prenyltransferase n=1 Tax=Streptacidiphilus sp. EB129 TaxID=3156262 RepID=UPI0035125AEC
MAASVTTSPPRPVDPQQFSALAPDQRVTAVRSTPGTAGAAQALRIVLMLGRPRTCVPGMLGYTLGWTVAGGPMSWKLMLGLAITLVYGLIANLYNCYTDLEEDSRNLPGRVWLVMRLGHRRLLWIGHAMTAALLLLSPVYSLAYLPVMCLAMLGSHQYSFTPLRLKARPLLGLLCFSLAVFGPYLLGYLGAPRGVRPLGREAWALLAFIVLWFVAKGMVKNLPDYDGDLAAGLRTSATVFPDRGAASRAAAAMTLLAYLSVPAFVLLGAVPWRTLWALPLAVWAYLQCRAMAKAPDGPSANRVLKRDMLLSTAFLSCLLLLRTPGWATAVTVLIGAVVLLGSDRIALDSRRDRHSGAAPAKA